MKTLITIFLSLLITTTSVFAHGENLPGPHGGEIRMPGNFHTEVVFNGDREVKVYLLDVKFESPTTINSAVSVEYQGLESAKASCTQENDHFKCSFKKSVLNTKGALIVQATREGRKGNIAKYDGRNP